MVVVGANEATRLVVDGGTGTSERTKTVVVVVDVVVGAAVVVGSPEDAVQAVDGLAPEHLEVQTDRDDWYFEQLRNYGSIFIGPRATVAFSDKAIGTNHTLPTGQAARYSGGLSVAKFLKTLTFQRVDTDAGVGAIAPAVAEISRADLMPAHEATANLRIDRWAPDKRS